MLCREMVLALIVTVSIGFVSGCSESKNSGLVDVRGDVHFNGQPVQQGTIALLTADRSNIYSGRVKDGHFTIGNSETGMGVPPGTYDVTLTAWETPPGMGKTGKEAIPKKYFDPGSSGLQIVVAPESARHDFDLKP